MCDFRKFSLRRGFDLILLQVKLHNFHTIASATEDLKSDKIALPCLYLNIYNVFKL